MSHARPGDRSNHKKIAAPAANRVKVAAGAGRPAKPIAKASKPVSVPTANGNGKHPVVKSAEKAVSPPAKLAAKPIPAVPAKPPQSKPTVKPAVAAVKPVTRPETVVSPEKDLASRAARAGGSVKDQIVLTVPDAYWLHAYWQLSVQSIQRAEAALGQEWHGAKPILRLYDVTSSDTTSTSEASIRDIPIHGGCTHWYIDVPQPPRSYRVDVGYLTRTNRFFSISRSNVAAPPKAGASESLDENWTAAVEEKPAPDRPAANGFAADPGTTWDHHEDPFQKPTKDHAFGPGATLPGKLKKFFFDIDAHLIVTGRTDPTAAVTLQNEPVKLRPDGTFTMRFSLPDSRQIIPAVATAADGMEEQTIVLAVERNTKRLDPMIHDLYGDG
jgi:hypothetical protein